MYELAAILISQGKYLEVKVIQRKTWELMQRTFGKEHPATLQWLHSLAEALHYQSKHDDAEEMTRLLLRLRQKVLGKEHVQTLKSMNLLTGTLIVLKSTRRPKRWLGKVWN